MARKETKTIHLEKFYYDEKATGAITDKTWRDVVKENFNSPNLTFCIGKYRDDNILIVYYPYGFESNDINREQLIFNQYNFLLEGEVAIKKVDGKNLPKDCLTLFVEDTSITQLDPQTLMELFGKDVKIIIV